MANETQNQWISLIETNKSSCPYTLFLMAIFCNTLCFCRWCTWKSALPSPTSTTWPVLRERCMDLTRARHALMLMLSADCDRTQTFLDYTWQVCHIIMFYFFTLFSQIVIQSRKFLQNCCHFLSENHYQALFFTNLHGGK